MFISKVSWITFALACYFGYKNFSIKAVLIGILIAVGIVHLMFFFAGSYLKNRFGEDRVKKIKTYFEYALLVFIIYYVIF